MQTILIARRSEMAATPEQPCPANPRAALGAALLGFFVITLDAVVINVALPAIGHQFSNAMSARLAKKFGARIRA